MNSYISAIKIIDSKNLEAVKNLLHKTTDQKVFAYALTLDINKNWEIWDTLLLTIPSNLIAGAVKKYKEYDDTLFLRVIYNPKISDLDLEYALNFASQTSGLDYIFNSLRGNMSTRLALKLSEVARTKDLESIDIFYGLCALRIFCIQRMLSKSKVWKNAKVYLEKYAASDIETWAEKSRPSLADFLFVAATLFLCIKSLGIIGFKPNILLELK